MGSCFVFKVRTLCEREKTVLVPVNTIETVNQRLALHGTFEAKSVWFAMIGTIPEGSGLEEQDLGLRQLESDWMAAGFPSVAGVQHPCYGMSNSILELYDQVDDQVLLEVCQHDNSLFSNAENVLVRLALSGAKLRSAYHEALLCPAYIEVMAEIITRERHDRKLIAQFERRYTAEIDLRTRTSQPVVIHASRHLSAAR